MVTIEIRFREMGQSLPRYGKIVGTLGEELFTTLYILDQSDDVEEIRIYSCGTRLGKMISSGT